MRSQDLHETAERKTGEALVEPGTAVNTAGVASDAPIRTIDELFLQEWSFVPTGDALFHCDDKLKKFSESILRDQRGMLCAACQTIRCDETSLIVIHTEKKNPNGNIEFSPRIICSACMAKHSKESLIALGKADKLYNAVTVAQ